MLELIAGLVVGLFTLYILSTKISLLVVNVLPPLLGRIILVPGIYIHEASHAIVCVAFNHKITEFKFLILEANNPTLGYVRHSYNQQSLYQVTGNFFIGIAPLFGGLIAIDSLLSMSGFQSASLSAVISSPITLIPQYISNTIRHVSQLNLADAITLTYLLLVISISFCPSKSDFFNATKGFILFVMAIIVAYFVADVLHIDFNLSALLEPLLGYVWLANVLSLITLVFLYCVSIIKGMVHKALSGV